MNVTKSREPRKNQTESKSTQWKHLRYHQLNGHKFRRQAPIGPYISDFVYFEKKLIIELDGGQSSDQVAYDSGHTKWLEAQVFRVLRSWNIRVLQEIKDVVSEALEYRANTPHPNLPHLWGKEQKQP